MLVQQVLEYFPNNIYMLIRNTLIKNNKLESKLEEIRIRINQPIILKTRDVDIIIEYNIKTSEILQTLEKLCENSIYAYKTQICNGYITIKGGHRIGIVGTAVIEENKIINMKYITSLNIRIARQVVDCSNKIIKEIIDRKNNQIYTTVLVSPPGKGKTTMLRDVIRKLSNGIDNINFKGKTCGVVDERGELAASHRGIIQNDLGIRTDVIENISKAKGMKMLIRSMAPEIIACDEIGTKEDVEAIQEAISAGIKGIFTMHGRTIEDIKNNLQINYLIETKQIEKIIFL